eukprot:1140557-Pelagomonas_calceolata.AAC.4
MVARIFPWDLIPRHAIIIIQEALLCTEGRWRGKEDASALSPHEEDFRSDIFLYQILDTGLLSSYGRVKGAEERNSTACK